jgi:thiamine-phosphate diphosphorylase
MRKHALHVLTTGRQELAEVSAILSGIDTSLIDAFHVREKQRGARELLHWHARLKPLLPHTAVVLNDRVDAALAAPADGVQLGYSSLPAAAVRQLVPRGMRVGCSVHEAEEAAEAARQGADYVIFGHVYATGSKPGLSPRGIGALAEVVAASPVPVIAIGGIGLAEVDEVLSTGCAGIAVLSSVLLHSQPAGQVAAYRERLDSSSHKPKKGWFSS